MKIIILMGSPNKKGSTNILVEQFVKGASENQHQCEVIDICHRNIKTCIGCVKCEYNGPCVQKDDMEMIREKLLSADMVVFATPLYYFTVSAQMKTVIDRFTAFNERLTAKHLKSVLLSVAWNNDDWTFNALERYYQTLVRYLELEDCGMVLGYGCGTPTMTESSIFPNNAYKLGKSIF